MHKVRETVAAPATTRSRSFDGFVLAAITIVTMALGLAAFFQLGMGAGSALIVVIASHVAMTCAHIAIRRGHRIRELSDDVERLRQDGIAPPARARPPHNANPVAPAAPHPAGPLTARPPEAPAPSTARPEATGGQGSQEARRRADRRTPATVAAPRPQAPLPPPDSGPLAVDFSPPMPPAAEPFGLEVIHAGPPAMPPAIPHEPLSPEPGEQQADISRMWMLRPGQAREPSIAQGPLLTAIPEVVIPDLALPAGPSGSQTPLAAAPLEPADMPYDALAMPGALDGTASPDAPMPAPTTAGTPDELATIQALIKRLADDLSAPRKPEPPELAPAAQALPQEDMISRSVEALRETADLMRHAAPAALRSEPRPLQAPAAAGASDVVDGQSTRYDVLPVEAVAAPAADSAIQNDTAEDTDPVSGAIAEAVAEERYAVYVEPIHGLPDGKARHFEVSVRIDLGAGQEIDPRELTTAQCDRAMLTRIDGAKFLRTASFAARLLMKGKQASVHSTVAATSLAEDIFVDGVADGVGNDERLATHLVLSFSQADVRTFSPVHWEALRTLAALGVRFAIEHIVDVDMDLEGLKAEGFDFVKLDAEILTRGLPAGTATIPPSDICRYLAGIGMSIIVGGIDNDRTRALIMGFGAVLGRGALFGGPRQVTVDTSRTAHMAAA